MAIGMNETTQMWCGRSWEGLIDRRCQAFAHAQALKRATQRDSHRVASEFLEFFDATGTGLMRDEEEWVFSSLRPAPGAVIRALEEHTAISSLIQALIHEAQAGCADLRVLHRLGALLESHLLAEEEEVRPLVSNASSHPDALNGRVTETAAPAAGVTARRTRLEEGAVMSTTRMTGAMKRSLEVRLKDLEARIATLDEQTQGDDSVEATALMIQLTRERFQIADALRDAELIDDEPFDFDAIEIGDLVTIQSDEGEAERYVLVDDGVRTRARSDWVSVNSPLGAALVGRGRGERIEVHSPQGPLMYMIVDFERAAENVFVSGTSVDSSRTRDLPSEVFFG